MKLSLFTLIAFLSVATQCTAKIQIGKRCTKSNDCDQGLYCDQTCKKITFKEIGATCDKKNGILCKYGRKCEDNKCSLGKQYEKCKKDDDCESGACDKIYGCLGF